MSNPLIGLVPMTNIPQPAAGTVDDPSTAFDESAGVARIDGTPVRVVTLVFVAAAGLVGLKLAGFRFNVGVSNS